MTERLDAAAIEAGLTRIPGWSRVGDEIRKEFVHASFADAIAFVVRVGFLAEAADHHPDLDVRYRRVVVGLTTHAADGLTARDFDLAASIEKVAGA